MLNESIRFAEMHARLAVCLYLLPVLLVMGACIDPPGGASDVPCTVVPEWAEDRLIFRSDGDTLLITEDSNKRVHLAVIRFDPISGSFMPATDLEWEQANGEVESCCLTVFEEGGFVRAGTSLYFNDSEVPVAGGTAVRMSPSLPFPSEFVAVASTNGRLTPFGVSTGQHFHQVFSLANGEQVGRSLRVGVGGIENGAVVVGWLEIGFVVYEEPLTIINPSGRRVCVVDTRNLAGLE